MSKTKGVAIEPKENELVVLDPEQYEVAIQERISTEVKKYNIADGEIDKLKDQYAGITVPALKDKEGIKVMKDALSHITGLINRIEDKRKELKDYYLRTGKGIDDEAKRLKDMLEAIREPLKITKSEFDRLEKEEKERKIREEEEKLEQRVASVKEAGMTFDGCFYVLGPSISMDIVTLKGMKDADFEFFIAKIKIEVERLAKIKEEEDRIAAEEQRKQQEILVQQQNELAEQQRKMKEQQEAFQKQQDEFAAQQRRAAQEETERKNQILKEMVSARSAQLEGLGFVFRTATKEFEFKNKGGSYKVAESTLGTSGPEYWLQFIEGLKPELNAFNIRHDEIEAAEREEQRKKALAEQQRKEEAQRKAEEEKAEALRQQEEERLAALPDLEKMIAYFQMIQGIEKPSVSSEKMIDVFEAFSQVVKDTTDLLIEELEETKTPAGE
jgi:DNA repair exonuclease SbcCD ATPase subunit